MSRAWVLVRGGIRPPAVLPGVAPDVRRRRRGRFVPDPWVSRETRAEISARLDRGEPFDLVAASLGLQIKTVQFVAIELDRAHRLRRGA